MEIRFRQYRNEKSELSPRVVENPVVSPKSTFTYLPYSQSVSRGMNSSSNILSAQLRTPREINQMRMDDFYKFESLVGNLIEKSKPLEYFHLISLNLKTLGKLCTSVLPSTEKSSFNKLYRNILENLSNGIDDMLNTRYNLKKHLKELNSEKFKVKDLTISNKLLQNQVSSTTNKLTTEKPRSESFSSSELINRKYIIEKEKLLEKIQTLEEHIAELKDVTKIEQISSSLDHFKTSYEKLGKEYKLYSKEKDSHIFKLQQEIGMLKSEITSNRDYLSNYQVKEKQLESELSKLKFLNKEVNEELNEAKNCLGLFREDMVRFFNYKELHDGVLENLNVWKNKYLQLEINVMAGNLTLSQDGVVWVDLDDPLFEVVRRGGFLSGINQLTQGTQMNKLDFLSLSQRGRRKSNFEVAVDLSEIDLKELKLSRPNFAAFLEINDSRLPFESPFNNWLECTIRGIYDSKYYEHLLCSPDSGRCPSRFPEFTYAWLGNFTIDKATRVVKELEIWKKPGSDKIRLDLLLGLSQDKYKKNWEIQTFIGFINEHMTIDELGFFLHCRNLLFKGPQLSIAIGQFSNYHVLNLKRVEEVIDLVMEKISLAERLELKNLLAKKSKIKEGNYSIDSGLVLRLMLEYYIREKKSRYVAIRTLFNLVPKAGNSVHLDFNAFKEIITNLNPEASEQTIGKLFRDSYSLSNGIITPDIIFIVCNETSFFFHSLHLKIDKNPSESEIKLLCSIFHSHKADINLIRDVIKTSGVSEILFHFNKLEHAILTKDSSKGFISIRQLFKNFWVLIKQLSSSYTEANTSNFLPFYTETMLNDDLQSGPEFCKAFVDLLESLVIYKLSTKRAIRKIQRNWKGRSSQKMVEQSVGAFKKLINK